MTYVTGTRKGYTATMRLGQATVTDDAEGEVTATADPEAVAAVTDEQITAGLAALPVRSTRSPAQSAP